jgi:hypothetical protein
MTNHLRYLKYPGHLDGSASDFGPIGKFLWSRYMPLDRDGDGDDGNAKGRDIGNGDTDAGDQEAIAEETEEEETEEEDDLGKDLDEVERR